MKDYCKVGRVIEWSEDYPNGDIETICGVDENPGVPYCECENALMLDDVCLYHRDENDSCWNCKVLIKHLPLSIKVLYAIDDL